MLLAAVVIGSIFVLSATSAVGEQSAANQKMYIEIPEVAVVALVGPDTLTLDTNGDREGTLLLQYTAVNAAGMHREIFVNWRADNRAPSGTSLRVKALNVPAGCGVGGAEVVVSDRPVAVIHAIPSCSTGRGSAGALLEYRLSVDDPPRLIGGDTTTVTLLFTMSDDL